MSEEEAYAALVALRFPETDGEPFCERCDCATVYKITRKSPSRGRSADAPPKLRPIFKCKACHYQFSVTSGTIFASHKMEFRDILLAIAEFANGAKGVSALQLRRQIGHSYKAVFVLAHKLRETLNALQVTQTLNGEVEIDATYTGGYLKPSNLVRHRVDRRRRSREKVKCVTIMRERRRDGRSLPFVCSSDKGALPTIQTRVLPGSIVHADDAPTYNPLDAIFDVRRIDHTNEGYAKENRNTNQAESFFSRFKRSIMGVHHHVSGPYTQNYASEMSWREDNRRISNGEQRSEERV